MCEVTARAKVVVFSARARLVVTAFRLLQANSAQHYDNSLYTNPSAKELILQISKEKNPLSSDRQSVSSKKIGQDTAELLVF